VDFSFVLDGSFYVSVVPLGSRVSASRVQVSDDYELYGRLIVETNVSY
jgi:hypothetical protein